MSNNGLFKKLLGEWSTKTIVAIAIGAALYGLLMNVGIPIANVYINFAMVVPVVIGGLYGPLPALLTTFVGNIVSDAISGGFWIDWSLGNAVLGFFVGMMQLYGADIRKGVFKGRHVVPYIVTCLLGTVLGFIGVAPSLNHLLHGTEYRLALLQGAGAAGIDFVMLLALGIPVLLLLAKRFAKRTNLEEEPDESAALEDPDALKEADALEEEEDE